MARKKLPPAIINLDSDEMCLVCGIRPRGSVMKHNRPNTLYCGYDCSKAATRNFKRRTTGDTVGKLMLTLKSLGEEYGEKPITTKEWIENLNRKYKTSVHFNRPLMLTNMVRGIINPETLEVQKNAQGGNWKFRYLGGETISEWLAPNSRAKFDDLRNEIGGTAAVVSESYEAESSEATGQPSRDNDRVAVGDRVRSYDFVLPDGTLITEDAYIEGTVSKIGESEYCPCGTDHVFILVERVVRNGNEVSATGMDMAFPVITESFITVLETKDSENWKTCALCGEPAIFTVEDTPVGPRNFCCERCYAQYMGLPVEEPGYYGLEAEMRFAPEYYVHSPDEFYGPYYSLEEAEEAVERLMRRGIEIRGITEGQDNWMAEEEESELWEEVGKLYATKNQLFEVIGTDECSICNEKLDYSMYGLAYKKYKPNLTEESPVICGECFDSLTPDDWQPINRFGHKGMQNMKKNPEIKVFRYVEDVGCRCPRCQWNIKFAQLFRDGKLIDGELPPNWEAKIGKSLPKVWIEDYEKDYPGFTYRDTKKGDFTDYDWDWMLFYRCASCNEKHYIEGDEKIPFTARHYAPQTGRKYVYYDEPSGDCEFCWNGISYWMAEDWNWGGDPDGPLAQALRRVKNNPKKIKPLELVRLPKSETEEKESETWAGPFGIETRTPTGGFKKWEQAKTYDELVEKLTEMFENEGFSPYALDVYAERMPRVEMTATGPVVVNDRKVLLATYKYGKWESGPWAAYLPKP